MIESLSSSVWFWPTIPGTATATWETSAGSLSPNMVTTRLSRLLTRPGLGSDPQPLCHSPSRLFGFHLQVRTIFLSSPIFFSQVLSLSEFACLPSVSPTSMMVSVQQGCVFGLLRSCFLLLIMFFLLLLKIVFTTGTTPPLFARPLLIRRAR